MLVAAGWWEIGVKRFYPFLLNYFVPQRACIVCIYNLSKGAQICLSGEQLPSEGWNNKHLKMGVNGEANCSTSIKPYWPTIESHLLQPYLLTEKCGWCVAKFKNIELGCEGDNLAEPPGSRGVRERACQTTRSRNTQPHRRLSDPPVLTVFLPPLPQCSLRSRK